MTHFLKYILFALILAAHPGAVYSSETAAVAEMPAPIQNGMEKKALREQIRTISEDLKAISREKRKAYMQDHALKMHDDTRIKKFRDFKERGDEKGMASMRMQRKLMRDKIKENAEGPMADIMAREQMLIEKKEALMKKMRELRGVAKAE